MIIAAPVLWNTKRSTQSFGESSVTAGEQSLNLNLPHVSARTSPHHISGDSSTGQDQLHPGWSPLRPQPQRPDDTVAQALHLDAQAPEEILWNQRLAQPSPHRTGPLADRDQQRHPP